MVLVKESGGKIEKGAKIVLKVHYNVLSANPKPDQKIVGLRVVDKETVMVPVFNPAWSSKGGVKIPAGKTDVKHVWSLMVEHT